MTTIRPPNKMVSFFLGIPKFIYATIAAGTVLSFGGVWLHAKWQERQLEKTSLEDKTLTECVKRAGVDRKAIDVCQAVSKNDLKE